MQRFSSNDPIWEAIESEERRQESHLELIASENHTSSEVMAAMGTCLTDKYAEGYPGRRYYGGCEHVDEVERICRNRAKSLFDAKHANVQPHSGTQANVAAFLALLQPGDKILAMSLDHGGHLSHGHPKNFSGVFYEFHSYGVEKRHRAHRPTTAMRASRRSSCARRLMHGRRVRLPAHRSTSRSSPRSRKRGRRTPAWSTMAHIAGPGGRRARTRAPVPHADIVTTMTTHKTLRGPRGGLIVCEQADWIKQINSAIFPGGQGGPLMHVIAAKAVALREALRAGLRPTTSPRTWSRTRRCSRATLAERGLRIVSGGTDNHLMLVDVIAPGPHRRGRGGSRSRRVDITCNKNLIPYDQNPPMKCLRRAHRHPGGDDARPRYGRDAEARQPDRRRLDGEGRRGRGRAGDGRGRRADVGLPDPSGRDGLISYAAESRSSRR